MLQEEPDTEKSGRRSSRQKNRIDYNELAGAKKQQNSQKKKETSQNEDTDQYKPDQNARIRELRKANKEYKEEY